MGRKRAAPILDPLNLGDFVDLPVAKKPKLIQFKDEDDSSSSDEEEMEPVDVGEEENEKQEILPGWMKNGQVLENWKEVPIDKLGVWLKQGMQERLIKALPTSDRDSLTLFPVQAAVLPGVIRGVQQIQDLCPIYNDGEIQEIPAPRKPIALGAGDALVCAPTGSGKTLAYVLPIVQALENRIIPHTRALVLLPSRDLALQVFKVFKSLIEGRADSTTRPLRVVKCLGQSDFIEEQKLLQFPHVCDIIIATPGRLMDHLNSGFSLRHLQYLIIDEADRLLMQSYQDWVVRILTAAREANNETPLTKEPIQSEEGLYKPLFTLNPSVPSSAPLRKYLFSATLTRNPAKIANLQLHNPLYFHAAASGRFTIPELLGEFKVICQSTSEKPLVLVHLLRELALTQVLCFTKSVEATHRLFILLKYMGFTEVAEYSSTLSQSVRSDFLNQFRSGDIKLLICSDAMARGMDIEDVDTVINYDTPSYIKTYVHRAGRTARAGKEGKCYSILATGEVSRFHKMRRKAEDPERVLTHSVNQEKMKENIESFGKALKNLKKTLNTEKHRARRQNK